MKIERISILSADCYVAPSTDLEAAVCAAFSNGTAVHPVGMDDDIFDLGGDSLVAEAVATELSALLKRRFPLSLFVNLGTPRKVCAWGTRAGNVAAPAVLDDADLAVFNAEMQPFAPEVIDRRMRALRLGPKAGVNATAGAAPVFWWFNNPRLEVPAFAKAMRGDVPVVAMYSGGLLASTIPLARHRALAEAIAGSFAQELAARYQGVTFRLGGNCFGGRIADLVGQKLVAAGHRVEALCVMEYAHTDLYDFAGRLKMLFGREGDDRFYAPIQWGEAGWEAPFRHPPQSAWIGGGHGQYFDAGNIDALSATIFDFFRNTGTGRMM